MDEAPETLILDWNLFQEILIQLVNTIAEVSKITNQINVRISFVHADDTSNSPGFLETVITT
jgi:ABC-type polysaccharide/polyol phosphate export permease